MMMGSRVMDCSQYTSFQLMEGSKVLAGIPYSSVTAASCLEIWENMHERPDRRGFWTFIYRLIQLFSIPGGGAFTRMVILPGKLRQSSSPSGVAAA